MAYTQYSVKGNRDPGSKQYSWHGLVTVDNDNGIIVDAAPVWGIWLGKPMDTLMSISKERGYLIEPYEPKQVQS